MKFIMEKLQVLCCVDRLEQLNETLCSFALSLSAALNLMHLITSLKGNPLPLDGTIVNNSGQVVLRIYFLFAL